MIIIIIIIVIIITIKLEFSDFSSDLEINPVPRTYETDEKKKFLLSSRKFPVLSEISLKSLNHLLNNHKVGECKNIR